MPARRTAAQYATARRTAALSAADYTAALVIAENQMFTAWDRLAACAQQMPHWQGAGENPEWAALDADLKVKQGRVRALGGYGASAA